MIIMICAFDENFGIGKNNKIPWHIKEDFEIFKNKTQNNIVVFGKNTYLSLPKRPLSKRINIVISKTLKTDDNVLVFEDLEKAIKYLREKFRDKKIFICGGEEIYKEGLKYSKYLYLSFVKGEYECDRFFPKIDLDRYNILEEKNFDRFVFRILGIKKNN